MLPGVLASHSQKRRRDISAFSGPVDTLPNHELRYAGHFASAGIIQEVRMRRRSCPCRHFARARRIVPIAGLAPAGAGAPLRRAEGRLRSQRSVQGRSELAKKTWPAPGYIWGSQTASSRSPRTGFSLQPRRNRAAQGRQDRTQFPGQLGRAEPGRRHRPGARVPQQHSRHRSAGQPDQSWTQWDHLFEGGRGPHQIYVQPFRSGTARVGRR